LVALGVHALLVGDIVAPLDSPRSSIAGIGPNRATGEQAGSGADSRPGSRTSYGRTDRTACRGPESGAGNGSGDRAILQRLLRGNPNLLVSVTPAQSLLAYEKIEGLAWRGHYRNARA